MRREFLMVLTAVLVAACGRAPSVATDPYPLPARPPNMAQWSPAGLAEPVTAVLVYLQVRPGDEIELVGAEPIGSFEGATVRLRLSPPVVRPHGDEVVTVIGEVFEPLEGAVVTSVSASPGPADTVGIVGELIAQRPGRFEVTSVRLRYRLNGGDERMGEGIDQVWTVCADDPKPATCEPLD